MEKYIFKGPQYYREEDKEFFKGREKEAAALFYMVKHTDFSVCYAESGEGKSSLINAGLFPLLRENGLFPIQIKFVDDDFKEPLDFDIFIRDKIDKAVNEAKETKKDKYETLTFIKTQDVKECEQLKNSVWMKLRVNELRLSSYDTITPVLIFDQFEEVFTHAKDINWTDEFFKWLDGLYKDEVKGFDSIGCLPKRFKVLLSMRSDFVSELDYWSMTRYFIPSLKNNRYCLKALTKESAVSVIDQLSNRPKGLRNNDILEIAKIEKAGDVNKLRGEMPCISALVLSLVLTEFEKNEKSDDILFKKIEERDNDTKDGHFLLFIMNRIYEKALAKCGMIDEQLRDKFEEILIDSHGRRLRIPLEKMLSNGFEKSRLTELAEERIINFVGDCVELSHDSLRRVVESHNKERLEKLEKEKLQAEQAEQKAVRQKHNVYMFICMFVAFCSSYLYLYLFGYDTIVKFAAGKEVKGMCAFLKIIFTALIILAPVALSSFLYLRRWGRAYYRNVSIMFLWLMFVYAVLLYKDVVFCPIQGYRSNLNETAWMTWIVPFIYFSIYQKKKFWHFLVYAVVLVPVTLNAFCLWQMSFFELMGYLLFVSAFIIYSFVRCKIGVWYKILWSISNIFVLFASVFFQLGFNVCEVDYNQVVRKSKYNLNWETVVVNSNNKIGMLSSLSGDTILPCVFDGISQKGLLISKNNLEIEKDAVTGFFLLDDKRNWVYNFVPSFEYVISGYAYKETREKTFADSLKCSAAFVYTELRNEIIRCIQTKGKIDIKNILHFKELDSLSRKNTLQVLSLLKRSDSWLDDDKINNLYRTVSTDLCLCVIKDRFLNKDLKNVMLLHFLLSTYYFLEEKTLYGVNGNTYFKDGEVEYEFSTDYLIEGKSYAYSGMLHVISGVDILNNKSVLINKLKEELERLNSLNKSLQEQRERLIYKAKYVSRKMGKGQITKDEALSTAIKIIEEYERVGEYSDWTSAIFKKAEVSYKQLSDTVLNVLMPMIEDEKYANYSGSLIDICRELIKVGINRGYEDALLNADKLKERDSIRLNDSYKDVKLMQQNRNIFLGK